MVLASQLTQGVERGQTDGRVFVLHGVEQHRKIRGSVVLSSASPSIAAIRASSRLSSVMTWARTVASSDRPTLPSARHASILITASELLTALMSSVAGLGIAELTQRAADDGPGGHRLASALVLVDERADRLALLLGVSYASGEAELGIGDVADVGVGVVADVAQEALGGGSHVGRAAGRRERDRRRSQARSERSRTGRAEASSMTMALLLRLGTGPTRSTSRIPSRPSASSDVESRRPTTGLCDVRGEMRGRITTAGDLSRRAGSRQERLDRGVATRAGPIGKWLAADRVPASDGECRLVGRPRHEAT